MVKAVLGEETQLKLAEDRLFESGVPAQVGLVIGKLNCGLDRGFVFDLVPTPTNDAGEQACRLSEAGRDDKKGSKKKSQAESSPLVIDVDWVAEHARQVSKMLLGGMNVVGLYAWASENSFKASNLVLYQTVKAVADAAPFYDSDLDERLLVHISYSPRRWNCRNCILGSNISSSSLRPCDFKMGRVLASLLAFRCTYNFGIRLPIFREDVSSTSTLRDVLYNGLLTHAQELKGAKAVIDGTLVAEDEMSTSDGIHEIELLLPFMKSAPAEGCRQKEVVGVLVLTGSICSFAYLSPKEPVSQAVDDIKVLKDHCKELMSREDLIEASTILELETEAISLTTKSFWDVVAPSPLAYGSDCQLKGKDEIHSAGKESGRKSTASLDFNIVTAIAFALVSILVGLVFFILKT
ncbi:protein odr-4 homolog isoform X2 [Telopea speciosissima]|uniref:protein odr-4 homolog isoform X2 n=1 Tax=Telopea speciosissima TaxID=54955 RepID=UPI001CC4113C|nr:protein odr-4 homolog isoform X2 [Telopea speciosissima]